MSSQHANPCRNYRPCDDEYLPARQTIEAAGHTMNTAIRAYLRWLVEDPSRLALLDQHLQDVAAKTQHGRPRRIPRRVEDVVDHSEDSVL